MNDRDDAPGSASGDPGSGGQPPSSDAEWQRYLNVTAIIETELASIAQTALRSEGTATAAQVKAGGRATKIKYAYVLCRCRVIGHGPTIPYVDPPDWEGFEELGL